MATNNVNFKIKNGLVVEGTTGTINGADILTKNTDSDNYIIDLIGGSATPINTPDTVVLRDENGDFAAGTVTVNDLSVDKNGQINVGGAGVIEAQDNDDFYITAQNGYDIRMDASDDLRLRAIGGDVVIGANAGHIRFVDGPVHVGFPVTTENEVATKGYVDDSIGNIDLTFNTDEITEGTTNLYFTNQRALDATSAAYDAAGSADDAETAANTYTDNKVLDYTKTSDLDTTIDGYGYLKSADLSGYATESYVGTAIDNLVDGAPGLLDTLNEIAAAINDDENYATTMTTALSGKQNNLTAGSNIDITSDTISVTGLTSAEISDFNTAALSATAQAYDASGSANTAEGNANTYTNTALESYTTTANLENTVAGYGFAYDADIPTSTDALGEGTTNLYFTDGRAESAITTGLIGNASAGYQAVSVDFVTGNLVVPNTDISNFTTDDLTEGETSLYFTDERAVDAIDGANITPNTVTIDTFRKEEATHQYVTTASTVNVHSLSGMYESVKYLVRVVGNVSGTRHSQLTEILLTTDGNGNIALTEYGTIYTSESPLATFSATMDGGSVPTLTATTLVGNTEIIAAATMLSWAD